MTKKLFNKIIKNKTITFRGLDIGVDLAEVEKIEGSDFKKKIGSLSNYKYFYEVGEMEDLTIYYGFNPKDEKVDYIKLILETYPKFYWSEAGGTDILDFITLVESGDLEKYLILFDSVLEKIIIHFTNLLGDAKIETKDEVFSQSHHKFKRYIWISNDYYLTVTTYIDDKTKFDSATKRLQIELRKHN